MLKETIRQLVGSTEKMSMVMGGQMQLAGVSVPQQKALMSELKDNSNKKENYSLSFWV